MHLRVLSPHPSSGGWRPKRAVSGLTHWIIPGGTGLLLCNALAGPHGIQPGTDGDAAKEVGSPTWRP